MITTIQFDPLYLSGPIKIQAIAADNHSPVPLITYARQFGDVLFRDTQCMAPLTDEDIAAARAAGRAIIRLTLADDMAKRTNRLALTLGCMRGQE